MRDTVDEILERLDADGAGQGKRGMKQTRPRAAAQVKKPDSAGNDAWKAEPLLGGNETGVGLLGLPLPVVEDGLSQIMNLLRAPGPFPNGLRHGLTEELAAHGQHGDTLMAHLTPGEVVVPKNLQTPEVMAVLAKVARAKGISLAQYKVGAQQNQINPRTGAPAFAEIHSHVNVDGDADDAGADDGNLPAAGGSDNPLPDGGLTPVEPAPLGPGGADEKPSGADLLKEWSAQNDLGSYGSGNFGAFYANLPDDSKIQAPPNAANFDPSDDVSGAQDRESFHGGIQDSLNDAYRNLQGEEDPAKISDLQSQIRGLGMLLDDYGTQHGIDAAFLKQYTKGA